MRQWLRRYGIRPKKHLGQRFLVNPRVAQRLLAAWNLEPGTGVLEIGAGAGALTLPLLAEGLKVVAVEVDSELCALLRERAGEECPQGELEVLRDDILTLNAPAALRQRGAARRWILVGNLPYAITTPVLEWTIRWQGVFEWVAFMVQREYAARLLAAPGSAAYGSLTLWVGFHFRVRRELAVGAANFWPMPRVDSVVVRLEPRSRPPVEVPSAAHLERVVRAAFSHRRKVLAGSLSRGLGLERPRVEEALREAGIGPRRRAQECTLEEFAALARSLTPGETEKGGASCNRTG